MRRHRRWGTQQHFLAVALKERARLHREQRRLGHDRGIKVLDEIVRRKHARRNRGWQPARTSLGQRYHRLADVPLDVRRQLQVVHEVEPWRDRGRQLDAEATMAAKCAHRREGSLARIAEKIAVVVSQRRGRVPGTEAGGTRRAKRLGALGPWALARALVEPALAPLAPPRALVAEALVPAERADCRKRAGALRA